MPRMRLTEIPEVGLSGIIVIDKPEGLTSFDVVARARRRFRTRSVGHTGTLDPMATGVLPLCIAESTRIARFLTCDDKTYEAELRLGIATDSQDRMGQVIAEFPVPPLNDGDIESVLAAFRGNIRQVPPMFSAIRVQGERLYEKARRGEVVDREARDVTVHSLELTSRPAPDRLCIRVRCSKGTYIRTLANDIGEKLGCHAHLTALRRTQSGNFTLHQAVTLEEMLTSDDETLAKKFIGEREALSGLPEILVDEAAGHWILNGRQLSADALPGMEGFPEDMPVRLTSAAALQMLAVAARAGEAVRYLRVFPPADASQNHPPGAAFPP